MKECGAIKYGGLLVNADDPRINYDSFKDLGLICPCCKNTVFLKASAERSGHKRKVGDRVVEVKSALIGRHFAHHKNTHPAQVFNCETKMAKLSAVDRKDIERIARNQRANIFRAKFWRIVKTSYRIHSEELMERSRSTIFAAIAHVSGILRHDSERSPTNRDIIAVQDIYFPILAELKSQFIMPSQLTHTKEDIRSAIDKWNSILFSESVIGDPLVLSIQDFMNSTNLDYHALVVAEALDYLAMPRQQAILSILIEQALMNHLSVSLKACRARDAAEIELIFNRITPSDYDGSPPTEIEYSTVIKKYCTMLNNRADFEHVFYFVRDEVVLMLSLINWFKAFEDFK
jgi:hypothetical protein